MNVRLLLTLFTTLCLLGVVVCALGYFGLKSYFYAEPVAVHSSSVDNPDMVAQLLEPSGHAESSLDGNGIIVLIPSGASLRQIASLLKAHDVIDHPLLFEIAARVFRPGVSLHAGEFAFTSSMSLATIFDHIASSRVVLHSITIPEGHMTSQILLALKENPLLEGEVSNNFKEGALLPETYHFHRGMKSEALLAKMQAAMNEVLDRAWESRQPGLPINSKREALILASIIEKETAVASERRHVAGVFINRLRKNIRLQTDPTVIYAVTKGNYVLERPLSRKDLALESPYNTYRNAGLPPGPIANPGRASIEAALNPMETRDLYFVADGTGGHAFARTLQEHNENVAKWRKIERQRAR